LTPTSSRAVRSDSSSRCSADSSEQSLASFSTGCWEERVRAKERGGGVEGGVGTIRDYARKHRANRRSNHAYTHVHVRAHTRYAHMHACTHACVYTTHSHVRIHTYAQTHACTLTHRQQAWRARRSYVQEKRADP